MKQVAPILKYLLDLSGTHPDNLVKDELHFIFANRGRAFSMDHGPFYVDSVIIKEHLTGRVLEPEIDYMILQPYQDATMRTGKEVAAIVYIHNKTVMDELRVTYQVVGGEFSWSIWAIKQLIEELDLDNRPVNWLDVVGKPLYFPPTPHLHPLSDTYGWEYIGYMLDQIALAITNGDIGAREEMMRRIQIELDKLQAQINAANLAHQNHLDDKDNPHQVTHAQVGLGNLKNYVPLTIVQGTAIGASPDGNNLPEGYMEPHVHHAAVAEHYRLNVKPHIDARNNPHGVTKAQVGLGSVENYGVATKTEAEAGLVNNKYMTPLRVAEAISKQAGTLLQAHIDDKNNPHQVTKVQVGLGNLENYVTLTDVQATTVGNIDNNNPVAGYMTSRNYVWATREALRLKVQPHIDSRSNPHGVTKAQVGLGNIPNLMVHTSGTDNEQSVASGKALYDHARSGDHDDRYVLKSSTQNTSLKWENGKGYMYGGGVWRQIWPATWS